MADWLQVPHLAIASLNRILLSAGLVTGIVSYLRRKQEIGGWFLYFYFWISAVLVIYLTDALNNYRVFLPSSKLDATRHVALITAVYPRLLALVGVVVIAVALLKWREWSWIERLRLMLAVTAVIASISVALDVRYFPRSLFANLIRCTMLWVWLIYFYVSKRVHHVFRTRDWGKFGTGQTLG
jgi:uncharacterized membrane protein YidH (DUF202 family)